MNRFLTLLILTALSALQAARAEETICYDATLEAGIGSGRFAPLYISSLRDGTITSARNLVAGASLHHAMDSTRRFSWAYGVAAYAGASNSVGYDRCLADGDWISRPHRPAAVWLQELYGQIKYRSVMLEVGMRRSSSPILDQALTGGDLIHSGNTRPLPGVRAGFIEFQDIPFTNGWVQIDGEIAYYRYTDSDWWAERTNRFSGHTTSGQWGVYRRCYFRTKPAMPLSVTVGAQCASQFGGTTTYWERGEAKSVHKNSQSVGDFFKMFWPTEDGTEGFMQGNTLGSWDLKARYRMRDSSELSGYFQWPWEDGSGIGKLNGFDGLWGLEYKFSGRSQLVKSVLVEYLTLTNQSGPMHWDPDDAPGTTVAYRAEGADDYYNNAFYNPYAAYGMSIGSPMVMAPIYNRDGYMLFAANRMRGIHIGMRGSVGHDTDYRIKFGYRKAWGNGKVQLIEPIHSTSLLLEATHRLRCVEGLSMRLQFGLDAGSMPADAVGALLTVSYSGAFGIGSKKSSL